MLVDLKVESMASAGMGRAFAVAALLASVGRAGISMFDNMKGWILLQLERHNFLGRMYPVSWGLVRVLQLEEGKHGRHQGNPSSYR